MLTEEETKPMPVEILDWVMQGMRKMKSQGPCLGRWENGWNPDNNDKRRNNKVMALNVKGGGKVQ